MRKEIETQIVSGVSYVDIESFCKKQGESISHMSIKRHNDAEHIDGGFKRVGNPNNSEQGISDSEVDSLLEDNEDGIFIEIPNVTSGDELKSFARDKIREITANQMAIISHKQKQFMQGRGRYPQNEIQGLRTIVACLETITNERGNVLDVDRIQSKQPLDSKHEETL